MSVFVRNLIKGMIVLFCVLVSQTMQSQTVQKQNVTACKGDAVTLSAGGGDLYSWSDGSIGSTLAVTASTEKAYTVTVSTIVPNSNLVVNGDFSGGYTVGEFATNYTYNCRTGGTVGDLNNGCIFIGPNAHDVHGAFAGKDHTVGDGLAPNNFLIVNGSPSTPLWGQSITVTPNTTYAFSCWVSTLTQGTTIKFSINGTQLGVPYVGPSSQNVWKQFFILWNSGSSTTADIKLVDVQSGGYDDFGIDDISFAPVTNKIIEYTIKPIECTVAVPACANESITLTRKDGIAYNWSDASTGNSLTVNAGSVAKQVKVTVTSTIDNTVINGDFSQGYIVGQFTHDYGYDCRTSGGDLNGGCLVVGPDANKVHGAFLGKDHTVGDGLSPNNFLIINGAPNKRMWAQTVSVMPGTKYAFSTWVATLTTNTYIQFKINGVNLGSVFAGPTTKGAWSQFYTTYTTGANETSVDIEIVDMSGQNGNPITLDDFGLDDIVFAPLRDLVFTYNISPSSCDVNIVNNDTAICRGDSLELHVKSNGQLVGWSPDSVIRRPSMADTWAVPLVSNTFTATAKFLKTNLITNGNFEQGGTGFTTDYSLNTSLSPGRYFIATNPRSSGNTWPRSFGDHTSGSGNMMIFDGDNIGDKRAYSTSVYVTAGTKYLFATWIKNLHTDLVTNPPLLQFNVDGVDLGQIKFPAKESEWVSFSTPYMATATGWMTIEIRNKNTNSARNDFALDDIFFGEYIEKTDKVVVTVNPLPKVKLPNDTTIWAGSPLVLDAGSANSYEWNFPTAHATTQNLTVTNAGSYIVTVSSAAGCKAQDTIVVKERVGEMAYYRFCGCSMKDYTGNGFDATLNGPPMPTCVNSIFDQGYHFAGYMAEYIQPKTLPDLTQSFSLMAWIKPEEYFGNSITPIFTQGLSSDWITLWFTPTEIQILLNYQQPTQLWQSFTANVPLNQYSHIAATYDYVNHLINVYLNGGLVGSVAYNYPIVSANEGFYIGSSYPGGHEFFKGVIDEVRIFNTPLSASQIDSIYKITNKAKIDLGSDKLLENTQTVNLSAPTGYSDYLWQDASTATSYTVSKPGTYSIKVTDGDGCWYVDTVKIRYKYFDTLNYSVCKGSQYTLRSYSADSTKWADGSTLQTKTLVALDYFETWVDMFDDSVINRQIFIIDTISCSLTVNADTAICKGDSARLAASTIGQFMGWHPGNTVSDSMKLATHWIKPTSNSTYTASARFPQNNLLMNGDFEKGNTGFKTDYGFTTSIGPGEYFVGTTPYNSFTSSWARNFTDHTNGTGKMMVVDGNSTPNARVYYTTIYVTAGSKYTFSVWVKGVHKDASLNPAKLRFYVGNDALGAIDYPTNTTTWIQFSTVWTATTSGNVEIGIKNQNTQSMGNDFALDDMQFGEFTQIFDTVTVTIKQRPDISLGNDIKVCSNDSVVVKASTSSTATSFNWSASSNTSDTMQIWNSGTYQVSVTENGCINSDTINVTIDSIPHVELGDNWAIDCKATSPQMLDAGQHAYYGWTTGETTRTITPSSAGKYLVEVATSAGCKAKDSILIGYRCDGPKFNCNGNFYLSTTLSNKTQLNDVRFTGNGQASFTGVGSIANIDYNAIGFNYLDNYIYAFDRTNLQLIRIFADGTYTPIGNPEGLPAGVSFHIADCDPNGNFVMITAWGWAYVIDVMGTYPKVINNYELENFNGQNVADVAIHPETGLLYYFSSADNMLYKTDITNGVAQPVSTAPSNNIDHLGSMWFDSFGNIYSYGTPLGENDQTTLFKIDARTGADKKIAQGPTASGTDGCSCAYFVDMYKTPDKASVREGDTVTYSFAISNSTRGIQHGYTFVDSLPNGMSYIEYPATILGANVTKTIANNGREVLTASNTTIEEGITHFSVKVKVRCVTADTVTANTARIPDLPAMIGGPVISDDSTTIVLDDPAVVSITNFALPTVSVDIDKVCPNKDFTLTAVSNATSVEWLSPRQSSFVGLVKKYEHVDSLATGVYKFVATNNGCTDTAKLTVTVYPQPRTKIASKDAVCKGETLTLDAGTFASYAWSTGASTQTIDVITVGKKTLLVTVTDANGCDGFASKDVEVYDLPNPQITASNDSVCYGETITLDAGTFSSYKWSTSATTQSISVTDRGKQSFKVTVTDDHGCTDTISKIIKIHELPSPTITATKMAVCKGEIITLATDQYKTYAWTSGKNTQTISISDVGVHNVQLDVVDGNNCSGKTSISVEVYALPIPHISASKDSVCKNEKIVLDAGNFAGYKWSNSENTQTIEVSDVGRQLFKLTVTDEHNCSDTTSKKVRIYDLPTPSISASKDTVCKGDKITLDAGSYSSYKWSTTASSQTIEVTKLGTSQVTVTVTDGNGCLATTSKSVVVNDLPTPVITPNVESACFGNTITLDAGTFDGYKWSGGETSKTVSVSSVGLHSLGLTVTDANKCQNSTSRLVEIYALPSPTITASADAVCYKNKINLSTQSYDSYQWSTQEKSSSIDLTEIGVHNVSLTVTDQHKCTAIASKTVEIYELPKPQIVSSDADNIICADKAITLSLTKTYDKYLWLNKATGERSETAISPSYNTSGVINVRVTDAHCENEIETTITVNPVPVVDFKVNPKYCDKTEVHPTVSGANPQSYVWDDQSTLAKRSFTIPSGQDQLSVTASVTVTSDHDCPGVGTVNFMLYKTPDPKLRTIDSTCEYAPKDITNIGVKLANEQYEWNYGLSKTVYNKIANETNSILKARTISGFYIIKASNASYTQCSDTAVMTLIVYPRPTISVLGKQNICYNQKFQPITLAGKSVKWFSDPSGSNKISDSATYTPILDSLEFDKTFYAQITDIHGCESAISSVDVHRVAQRRNLAIIGDTLHCENERLETNFYLSGRNKTDRMSWYPSNQLSADSLYPYIPFRTGVDTLKVVLTDTYGCEYSISQKIYTSPRPSANFTWVVDNSFMTVAFSNTSDSSVVPDINTKLPNHYYWKFWKGNDPWKTSHASDTTLSYPYGYHDVQLLATNSYGCTDTILQNVFVDIVPRIYVPTVFNPEHPSLDIQTFLPKAISLVNYEIWVYDQWGNMLWYSNKLYNGQPSEGWDGSYKGMMMKSDTYIWKIRAQFSSGAWWKTADGNDFVFGNFLLVR